MKEITNSRIWREKTFLITTNNLNLLDYCDRVIVMSLGRVDFYGSTEEFREESLKKKKDIELMEERPEVRITLLFHIITIIYRKDEKEQ